MRAAVFILAASGALAACQGAGPLPEPPPDNPASAKAQLAPWEPPPAIAAAPPAAKIPSVADPAADHAMPMDMDDMDMPMPMKTPGHGGHHHGEEAP